MEAEKLSSGLGEKDILSLNIVLGGEVQGKELVTIQRMPVSPCHMVLIAFCTCNSTCF